MLIRNRWFLVKIRFIDHKVQQMKIVTIIGRRKRNIILFGSILFLYLVYFYPRVLSKYLGEDHVLSSYLYIYVFGIIFFIFNMWLLIRSKALNLNREGEKKWMWFFIGCLLWGCLMHAMWIFTATYFPFKG